MRFSAPKNPRARKALTFLLTASIACASLLLVGLFTDFRALMHWLLLTLATVAFFPFIILAALLFIPLILLILTLPLTLLADGVSELDLGTLTDAEDLETSEKTENTDFLSGYYDFIFGQRNPIFWGIPTGTLLACLLIWSVLAVTTVRAEMRTTEILTDIQNTFHQTQKLPRLNANTEILDGFGNPIQLETRGVGPLQVWILRSAGADATFKTNDDICIHGQSALAKRASTAITTAITTALQNRSPDSPLPQRLQNVLNMRCQPQ